MYNVAILTVSDRCSRGEREDSSGTIIREMLTRIGLQVKDYAIVPDEKGIIAGKLIYWADQERVDIIITTGGTGLSPRDVTPEATSIVIHRVIPGFAEAMRAKGLEKTPHAMLSREVCGTRNKTLIINLPGSPGAVRECLETILPALPHAIELIRGQVVDCAEAVKNEIVR